MSTRTSHLDRAVSLCFGLPENGRQILPVWREGALPGQSEALILLSSNSLELVFIRIH